MKISVANLMTLPLVALAFANNSIPANHEPASLELRFGTYNVLSDQYKNPAWEHVRHLADWGDCSAGTRCHLAKTNIENADLDVLALQEIPKAAFQFLLEAMPNYQGQHASSTAKFRGNAHYDGVGIMWKKATLSANNIPATAWNTVENSVVGVTDKKPAMLLYLRPNAVPNYVVGVASAHFGDSIYQSNENDSGQSKMVAIVNKLNEQNSQGAYLNVILGDYNQDQYYLPGYEIDAPFKGLVSYDEQLDKIKVALDAGFVSGAQDPSGNQDHSLSLTWTSPDMKTEFEAPYENLERKKLGENRFIDWGLFKASDQSKVKIERLHGDFDQFQLKYDADQKVTNIVSGENVLRGSDHLLVVFKVTINL
jgi:hypothetical protein